MDRERERKSSEDVRTPVLRITGVPTEWKGVPEDERRVREVGLHNSSSDVPQEDFDEETGPEKGWVPPEVSRNLPGKGRNRKMLKVPRGQYYQRPGSRETLEEFYQAYGKTIFQGSMLGDVRKYLDRLFLKDDPKKNLAKLKDYLAWLELSFDLPDSPIPNLSSRPKFLAVAPEKLIRKMLQVWRSLKDGPPGYPFGGILYLERQVREQPKEMTQLCETLHRYNFETVLDNNVYEDLTAANLELLLDAATRTSPDYLVLPDVYGDCLATIEPTLRALDHPRMIKYRQTHPGCVLTCVVCPTTNWAHVYTALAAYKGAEVSRIAVPFHPTEEDTKIFGRLAFLYLLKDVMKELRYFPDVHLFGLSPCLAEDVLSFQTFQNDLFLHLTSLDSAAPLHIALGSGGKRWEMDHYRNGEHPHRPRGYLRNRDFTPEAVKRVYLNCEAISEMLFGTPRGWR